jgi:hypothetical protein
VGAAGPGAPYPAGQIRSVTLLNQGRRLFAEVTAEVPVATYRDGEGPDPARVAGVDPGVIHPFAVAGPGGEGLLVSGRAIRAENHLHLADAKRRARAVARRAPRPGQAGSRRWRKTRARQRKLEAAHRRRVAQAQHEAAAAVIAWSVQRRVGTLKIGDPRGVLALAAGRRHNKRVRDWRIGHLLACLQDKAAGPGSPPCWSTSAAPPPPARPAPGGSPGPPGGRSPARTAGSPGTATLSAAPTSPPAPRAADPSSPGTPSRTRSRTAAPGTTCQVPPRHDVTPAPPSRQHPAVPWPAAARPTRTWGRRSPTASGGTRGSLSSTRATGQTLARHGTMTVI